MTASPGVAPFVPWPIPAAAGIVLGVAAHAAGVPLFAAAWGAAFAATAAVASRLGRSGPPPSWAVAAAVSALLVPVGWIRHAQREARPEPLAPILGALVELSGRSDGRLLVIDGLGGETVALRPSGRVPRGRVRVQGVLEAAEGPRVPGGFDERAWLRRRDGHAVLRVARVTSAPERSGLRDRVRAGLTSALPPPEAELMRALTLGEREGIAELREVFARAGLAHLLALSGLHLGVIAAAIGLATAPLGPARWLGVAAAAVAFAAWIGPTPSLARAAVMTAAAGATAAAGGGRPAPWTTLALACVATLAMRPDWAFDLGFQLSYASLGGILAFGAPLAVRFARGRPAWHPVPTVLGGVAVSAGAVIAGLPFVLSAFGEAPPFGPFVNLVALPLATVLVPGGLAAGFVGAVWPAAGEFGSGLLRPLASALLAVAEAGARLPNVTWGAIAPLGTALWTLGTAPWAWTIRGRLAPWRALTISTVAIVLSALAPSPSPSVEVVVLDVGQGDAIVLRLPGRRTVLVDAGGAPFSEFDVGDRVVVPALRTLGIRAIDLLVVTHADLDHAGGVPSVLRAMPVAALGYGHPTPGVAIWDRIAATASATGATLLPLRRGQRVPLGEATLHVLHPTHASSGDRNDDSVALRIDWRGRPWIHLLGDLSISVEADLAVPPAPLLLAPHHGSADGTSVRLLRAVGPEEVLISVGRANRYGHPAQAVLERVADVGATVARTDQDGTIRRTPPW